MTWQKSSALNIINDIFPFYKRFDKSKNFLLSLKKQAEERDLTDKQFEKLLQMREKVMEFLYKRHLLDCRIPSSEISGNERWLDDD